MMRTKIGGKVLHLLPEDDEDQRELRHLHQNGHLCGFGKALSNTDNFLHAQLPLIDGQAFMEQLRAETLTED